MKKKRIPEWKDVEGSRRQAQQTALGSITSLTQALVELITNVDDAYERLNKPNKTYQGDCAIFYDRGGETRSTTLKISDKAAGMDADKLYSVLKKHGDKIKSEGASRGFFARGLLDVSSIADVFIQTVKDKKISTGQIKYQTFQYKIVDRDVPINKVNQTIAKDIEGFDFQKSKKLKNGTDIILKIPPTSAINIPQVKTLIDNLNKQYQLRNILSDEKNKEFKNTLNLFLFDKKKNKYPINYSSPKAKLEHEEKIELFPKEGKKVFAYFQLYKTDSPMEESTHEYRHYGILTQGIKAIYENSFLDDSLNNESILKSYYGVLKCDYIDELAYDFEDKRSKKKTYTTDNPKPIHDQERRRGLTKDHPFVKNHLFKKPIQILNQIVQKHRKESGNDITDKEDLEQQKKKFDILHQELKNYENLNGKKLPYGKWMVFPKGLKIKEGETASFRVYTNVSEVDLKNEVDISFSEKYQNNILVKNSKSKFRVNPLRNEQCFASFEIEGLKECDYFDINVNYKSNLKTQVRVCVFVEKNRDFKKPLEFEKENYFVKENSGKNLTVFAKYPGFIDTKKIKLTISNSNQKAVSSSSEINLNYVEGTNYLKGILKVKGLKLLDSSTISVNHESTSSSTVVNVMKEKDETGTEYKPKYVTHFLGSNVRAAWKPQEENILEITTDHPLVRHYLGAKEPVNGKFPNFKTPQWKMFFNDILAHAFAEKMVAMNCSQKPETYETLASINKSDIKETMSVANKFYSNEFNKFMSLLHSEKVT
tara:strand:+ start:696 stop:2990 length:2295 start_codon:yes stop_codon:yes gene_type:complete